jgi:hypothetical protein
MPRVGRTCDGHAASSRAGSWPARDRGGDSVGDGEVSLPLLVSAKVVNQGSCDSADAGVDSRRVCGYGRCEPGEHGHGVVASVCGRS